MTDASERSAADQRGDAAVSGDAAMMPTQARAYVEMAGASDAYEIESSRMALEKSRNAEVRRFAEMMIAHHTETTRTLTAAARSAGMTPPPPAPMAMQRAMLDQLRPLTGDAFDAAYWRQQRQAHEMALALHRNYAQNGDMPALRQAASAAVPVVERHLAQLRAM